MASSQSEKIKAAQRLEEDKRTLEQEAVLVNKQLQAKDERLKTLEEYIKKLEDKVKQKEFDLEQLHQQYNDCAKSSDKYRHDTEYLQSEVDRLSSQLDRSEKERIEIMGKWNTVEQQRQNAEKQVSELQRLKVTLEEDKRTQRLKSLETVGDIFKKYAGTKEDMKELEDKVKQKESNMEQLRQQYNDCAKSRDKYCHDTEYLQSKVERLLRLWCTSEVENFEIKERWTAVEQQRQNTEEQVSELEDKLAEAQRKELDLNDQLQLYRNQLKATKKELERVTAGFAEERQQFQTRIAAGEKAKRSLEDKLAEAQRKELDLNDQLQLYCDQLEATKVALQVEEDKLHSTEESVCQKEKEVKKLKGDLQSERDKVQTMEEAALQKERELDQCKVALQVEKDKLHSTEESVRQKEKEVKKLKDDLQLERDKVQTMEEAALQKERELDQCKEGSAEYPSEKTTISALMDLCKYFKDENMETLERAAEEKQKIHASMKEADERVKEMASTIAALKECIQVQDAEARDLQAQLAPHQGMAVVPVRPPSDVADLTGDEVVLEQLCYMATGFKQLLISPDGGTFTLGNGDASLEFPPGAVEKNIHIRYAIILHGPFVFPASFKPVSVVVYINMDGATLVKPVQLFLSHWCIREETDDEETMKFVRAPHSLESEKKEYAFEEVEEEADFTTRTNVGVLTIQEPHCLYCVKSKLEKEARYCAMKFTRYDSSEETLLFRIQLSCDSLDWVQELASVLDRRGWQRRSASRDIMPQFCFSAEQIAASPMVSQGPGWNAMIEGAPTVKETDFLMPKGKSKAALKREVNSGRFPPYICYQILYSVSEERRLMPTFLKVDLHGADKPLIFSCRFYEAENPTSPVSPAFFSSATSFHTPDRMAASYGPSLATSGQSVERHPSSPQAEIIHPAATAVPDAVTDGPSATTPPTETAAEEVLDHFRDRFINDAASSDIMYELRYKDVISSGDVEMIERKADVTQRNQYLHECLKRKCTKEALMEVCNVMSAVRGNPKINALGKDMRQRVKASYGPSPTTSGHIPSAERHPSSPQADISKTADPTSPVSPAFFSSATSPHTPARMAASYGPSPVTSGQSAERHPSSPQAEISRPADVIEALNHTLDAQWRDFGTHLRVESAILDGIEKDRSNEKDRMLQLVEKWLAHENGTGDLPRTWKTVVQAVKSMGKRPLVQKLAQQYGVQPSGQ